MQNIRKKQYLINFLLYLFNRVHRMAEMKQDYKQDDSDSYSVASNVDPKNVQELTQYVSFFFFFSINS